MIHIQDAHANEEAQRNIAKILDYFAGQQLMRLITLEGAEGDLFTSLFSMFPNKVARKNIADYFLKEARLTGPEYLAIVDRPEMKLYGVEDRTIYEENRKAYVEALDYQPQDEKVLEEIGKVMDGVSRYVFSEDLRELIKRRSAFHEGGRELVSYVRYLIETAQKQNLALYDYPGMHSLMELVKLESEVDFDKAELEIEGFINDLKRVISREKLSRFLTNTVQFRMQKMKRADYYGYLAKEIKDLEPRGEDGKSGIDEKYSNVINYLKYMQLYDSIGVEIFDEINALEKGIKNKLFRSQDEVMLDRLYQILEIYRKMFEFTMTVQDANFFYTYRSEFKSGTFSDFINPILKANRFSYGLPSNIEIIDQDLPRVERFYAAALKRDQILIEKAVAKMESDDQKIMTIVTGGFHTPGIEKYLREKDYSYMVITPRIAGQIDTKKETGLYENALRKKPIPLETSLIEAFFPPRQVTLSDPRFQLAAWHMVLSVESGRETLTKFSQTLADKGMMAPGTNLAEEMNALQFIQNDPDQALVVFALSLLIAESNCQNRNPILSKHEIMESIRKQAEAKVISSEDARIISSTIGQLIDDLVRIYVEDPQGRKVMISKSGLNGNAEDVLVIAKVDDTQRFHEVLEKGTRIDVPRGKYVMRWIPGESIPGNMTPPAWGLNLRSLSTYVMGRHAKAAYRYVTRMTNQQNNDLEVSMRSEMRTPEQQEQLSQKIDRAQTLFEELQRLTGEIQAASQEEGQTGEAVIPQDCSTALATLGQYIVEARKRTPAPTAVEAKPEQKPLSPKEQKIQDLRNAIRTRLAAMAVDDGWRRLSRNEQGAVIDFLTVNLVTGANQTTPEIAVTRQEVWSALNDLGLAEGVLNESAGAEAVTYDLPVLVFLCQQMETRRQKKALLRGVGIKGFNQTLLAPTQPGEIDRSLESMIIGIESGITNATSLSQIVAIRNDLYRLPTSIRKNRRIVDAILELKRRQGELLMASYERERNPATLQQEKKAIRKERTDLLNQAKEQIAPMTETLETEMARVEKRMIALENEFDALAAMLAMDPTTLAKQDQAVVDALFGTDVNGRRIPDLAKVRQRIRSIQRRIDNLLEIRSRLAYQAEVVTDAVADLKLTKGSRGADEKKLIQLGDAIIDRAHPTSVTVRSLRERMNETIADLERSQAAREGREAEKAAEEARREIEAAEGPAPAVKEPYKRADEKEKERQLLERKQAEIKAAEERARRAIEEEAAWKEREQEMETRRRAEADDRRRTETAVFLLTSIQESLEGLQTGTLTEREARVTGYDATLNTISNQIPESGDMRTLYAAVRALVDRRRNENAILRDGFEALARISNECTALTVPADLVTQLPVYMQSMSALEQRTREAVQPFEGLDGVMIPAEITALQNQIA
ncbi:MAG: hypothetical protein PHS88_09430, partial [Candidatus Omnitrophica bacterium]|nr:hypothetical protein [Candidatus Omnitrophota bacterium]